MLALPRSVAPWRTFNHATHNFLFLSLYILYAIRACHPIFRIDKGPYQGVFVSDLQRKQDVADFGAQQQPNW